MSENTKSILRIAGLSLGIVAVAALAWFGFVGPYLDFGDQLAKVEDEIVQTRGEVLRKSSDRARLAKFRQISLPTDNFVARGEYGRYLEDLLAKNGFQVESLKGGRIQAPSKSNQPARPGVKADEPVYRTVQFDVNGVASLKSLARLLDHFHRERDPLLHRVKSITLEPQDAKDTKGKPAAKSGKLRVNMEVEGVIVTGAAPRPQTVLGVDEQVVTLQELDVLAAAVQRGPMRLAPLYWVTSPAGPTQKRKDYSVIARYSIFDGASPPQVKQLLPPIDAVQPPDMKQFTFLIGITGDGVRAEAFLRNRYTNKYIRVRSSSVFNKLTLTDEFGERVVMEGIVRKIDGRDLYLECKGEVYRMHLGDNLKDALRQPLSSNEMVAVGLKTVSAQ